MGGDEGNADGSRGNQGELFSPLAGEVGSAAAAREGARVVIAPGPRAAEQLLLEALESEARAAREEPRRLAQPVRIVVPSRRLREHVSARLVEERAGSAGVVVQTSWHVAWELLRGRGGATPQVAGGRWLLPLLIRRRAREQDALRRALDGLTDGYGAAVATVSDLLDAGLEPAHVPGLRECATELGRARGRAVALVEVARAVLGDLAARGLAAPAALFAEAAAALREGVELPARALWIHGFADATGVQADFLHALLARAGATLLLDHPPDPADAGAAPGPLFTARLRERGLDAVQQEAGEPHESKLRLVRAPGAEAEARAAAAAIHRLRARGARLETIGLVARDLTPYRAAIAGQLGRLGVPFSGKPGFVGPRGRRLAALQQLLERGAGCTVDAWLDASESFRALEGADLRLALHGIGIGRLGDAADLDVAKLLGDQTHYKLPVRSALVAPPDGEDALRAVRRRVARRSLESAAAAAAATRRRVAGLERRRPLCEQLGDLRRLVATDLDWVHDGPDARDLYTELLGLERELGGGFELDGGELTLLLRRRWQERSVEPLGGQGGGVQVLSITEARGLTFTHLFVLGCNRDVFPRVLAEDALLPDDARARLLQVLPDLPVKGRIADEERYLFAQLCAAAPHVTLSWQAVSDDGKERVASPFVERLRLGRELDVETASPVLGGDGSAVPRPAAEHAVRAALLGDEVTHRQALQLALGGNEAAAAQVQARLATLAELDGRPGEARLGPFFGLVGEGAAGDPSREPIWVTRLEGPSYCPWQTFLERTLRIEPVPDALAALPDVTPALLGNAVHVALEQVVARAGGSVDVSLEEAMARGPVAVSWPEAPELAQILLDAAEQVSRDEGIVLPGFARLLAERARSYVARVRELEWGEAGRIDGVIGAEVRACVDLEGAGLPGAQLQFKADRVDLRGGRLRLVDYKSGKPVSEAKKPETRRRHLLAQIGEGRRLQVVAYSLAGPGGTGQAAEGAYLFARPDIPDDQARPAVAGDDEEALRAFAGAVDRGLAAWRGGAFPPRLLDEGGAQENSACRWCAVAEACVRGDTSSRARYEAWLETDLPDESEAEQLARRLLTGDAR